MSMYVVDRHHAANPALGLRSSQDHAKKPLFFSSTGGEDKERGNKCVEQTLPLFNA
ncbi:hypothetical protein [Paenibacillus ihumii]|uniref:hypothetical protein n=1 Tax=Paenibacillus ihumii TaxID=687436 RepID=UPI000A562C60|nr:hypothetical protein [Paenibacillus ihumii]